MTILGGMINLYIIVSFLVYTFPMLLAVVNYFWSVSFLSTILHLLHQWSNVKFYGKKSVCVQSLKFLEVFKKRNVQVAKVLEFSKEKVQPLKFLKVFQKYAALNQLVFSTKICNLFSKFCTEYFTKLHLVVPLDKSCILYNETYQPVLSTFIDYDGFKPEWQPCGWINTRCFTWISTQTQSCSITCWSSSMTYPEFSKQSWKKFFKPAY